MANFKVYFRDNNNSDPYAGTYMEETIVEADTEQEALTKFYADATESGASLWHRSVDQLPY